MRNQLIDSRRVHARYNRSRDLINVGAYVSGSDPELDRAIGIFPRLEEFLRENAQRPIGEILELTFTEIGRHEAGKARRDDQTLVLVRVR